MALVQGDCRGLFRWWKGGAKNFMIQSASIWADDADQKQIGMCPNPMIACNFPVKTEPFIIRYVLRMCWKENNKDHPGITVITHTGMGHPDVILILFLGIFQVLQHVVILVTILDSDCHPDHLVNVSVSLLRGSNFIMTLMSMWSLALLVSFVYHGSYLCINHYYHYYHDYMLLSLLSLLSVLVFIFFVVVTIIILIIIIIIVIIVIVIHIVITISIFSG